MCVARASALGVVLAGDDVSKAGLCHDVYGGLSCLYELLHIGWGEPLEGCSDVRIEFAKMLDHHQLALVGELCDHATAVLLAAGGFGKPMNQVGGSLGTALIMSFSAMGMAASRTDGVGQLAAGYHFSFGAVLALAVVVCVRVALCVSNRQSDRDLVQEPQVAVDVDGVKHTVVEVMGKSPVTIPATAHMAEAARVLVASGASGAIVTERDGSVQGFLSNGDILKFFGDEMRAISGGGFMVLRELDDESAFERVKRLADINVGRMATEQVVSVGPDVSFGEACRILAEKRLKELPFVEDGRLVGALHRSDLMRAIASMLEDEER